MKKPVKKSLSDKYRMTIKKLQEEIETLKNLNRSQRIHLYQKENAIDRLVQNANKQNSLVSDCQKNEFIEMRSRATDAEKALERLTISIADGTIHSNMKKFSQFEIVNQKLDELKSLLSEIK